MKLEEVGLFVSLNQGLAINKTTEHLISNKKQDKFVLPLLRIADMLENKFTKFISTDVNKNVVVSPEDIIYTRTGQIGLVFKGFCGVVHNNSFIVKLNSKKIDKDYLFTVLNSTFFKNQALIKAKNSVQSDLTHSMFKSIKIPILTLNEQKLIAKIYNILTKKINNNNQINSQLEELAKTIYDYWFLQFEFPNEQGKPYKSSGGKMVYNEQLKREIPEGWEVVNIRDICSVTWGQCPDGENILSSNYNGNDAILYCSGAGDMRNGLLVDCQAKTNASRRYAHKNDILMSVAGSIGAMAICNNKISLGRAAAAFTPKENRLLYSYLTISKFISRMKDVSSGSIQKVVNDSHLNEMNIPYCKEIVNKFAIFNILINMEIKNEEQNKELSSLRDFLLPLLMNGQVTFKE